MSFHEIRFPSGISLRSSGGPERRTEIVVLGSGHEQRNTRWADSKRRYDAGYGVKSLDDLHNVIDFFEERRGRLYGFRWKDHTDFKSTLPQQPVTALDQLIATADGVTASYQLIKTYGAAHAPYARSITKPVQGTLLLSVDGVQQTEGTDFTVDYTTGLITFDPGSIPSSGAGITAGYEFDVPVRFDADRLEINIDSFRAGQIPNIPVVEIRL